MIGYIDSSMIVERAIGISRGEAADLTGGVATERLVSSALTVVEVSRVLTRVAPDQDVEDIVASALASVELVALASVTLVMAARLPVRFLKTLDSLHVASALLVGADVVMTGDRQMARACQDLGLAVA
ncbi:MAG: type II toxin-antitoxin system VapC family toxin [Actinobacteria bacterium]|nr:type II toxin-antitoxin system VapC family toxin [Actinomycetota bacterium]